MAFLVSAGETIQKCTVCRQDNQEGRSCREKWGCDAETPGKLQESVECPVCPANAPNAKCEACRGTGEVEYYRCPNAYISANPDITKTIRYFIAAYDAHGILPSLVGYMDHPNTFCEAMEHLANVKAKWEIEAVSKKRKNRSNGKGARTRGHESHNCDYRSELQPSRTSVPYFKGLKFQTQIAAGNKTADTSFRTLQKAISGVRTALYAFGVSSLSKGIIHGVTDTIEDMEDLRNMAQATLTDVEKLSRIEFAFRMDGASTADFRTAFKNMIASAREAVEEDGSMRKAFVGATGLGMSLVQIKDGLKEPLKLMLDIADAMRRTKDDGYELARAEKIFGRSMMAVRPTLNKGASHVLGNEDLSKTFGYVIRPEQIAQVHEITLAWERFQISIRNFIRAGLDRYGQDIIAVLDKLSGWIGEGKNLFMVIDNLVKKIQELWTQFRGSELGVSMFGPLQQIINGVPKAIAQLDLVTKAYERVKKAGEALGKTPEQTLDTYGDPNAILARDGSKMGDAQRAVDNYKATLFAAVSAASHSVRAARRS